MKKTLLFLVVSFIVLLSSTGCSIQKDVCKCDNIEKQINFEKNIECENNLYEYVNQLKNEKTYSKNYEYDRFASFYSPVTDGCIFRYQKSRTAPRDDPYYEFYDVLVDKKTDHYFNFSNVVFQNEKEINSCLDVYLPMFSGFNPKYCSYTDINLEIEYLVINKNYCICPMSSEVVEKNNAICEKGTNNMQETRYSFVKKYNHEKGSFYSPILNRCLQWEKYGYKPSKFENDTWASFGEATGMVLEYRVWSPIGLPWFNITDRGKKGHYDQNGSFIPTIDVMKNKELSAEEYFFKSIDYLKSNPTEINLFWDVMRYRGGWCEYFDRCYE